MEAFECLRALGDCEWASALDEFRECRGVFGDDGMVALQRLPHRSKIEGVLYCC